MVNAAQSHVDAAPAQPPPKPSRRKWTVGFILVGTVMAVLVGSCAYTFSQLKLNTNFNVGFGHDLKPIAVSATSCPYLRLVNATAGTAGAATGAASSASSDPTQWPSESFALGQKLRAFDVALRAAESHTPVPIALKLKDVDSHVQTGLANLTRARNAREWFDTTIEPVTTGYSSLVDASDLTGNACGFVVAPSVDVFLNPPSATP